MPRKTAGKLKQSAKAAAASKRNLANWESLQAYKNRVSDNLEVFALGFVAGACALFIVHVLSV